jgi:hypothetical protein
VRWISKLFDNYVRYNIHVGLAVLALAQITALDFNLSLCFPQLLVLFVASFLAYNFIKFHRLLWESIGSKFKGRVLFLGLTLSIILWFIGGSIQLSFYSLTILLFTLLLVLLYCLPLPGFTLNLRGLKGLKIHLVALSWVLTTIFLPLSMGGQNISEYSLSYAFQRYLFVLVATLPFEIRDLKSDDPHLSTWPQKFGVSRTRWLGGLLLFLFIFLEIYWSMTSNLFLVLGIAIILMGFIINSKAQQSKYFSSFWVEGIPILWLILKYIMI